MRICCGDLRLLCSAEAHCVPSGCIPCAGRYWTTNWHLHGAERRRTAVYDPIILHCIFYPCHYTVYVKLQTSTRSEMLHRAVLHSIYTIFNCCASCAKHRAFWKVLSHVVLGHAICADVVTSHNQSIWECWNHVCDSKWLHRISTIHFYWLSSLFLMHN